MPTPTCVWNAGALLGEGPVWSPGEAALYWVDIKKPALHRYTPETETRDSWPLPELVGCIAPMADGRLALALRSGLHAANPPVSGRDLALERLTDAPSPLAHMRFNDGKVAPDGLLWLGTMDNREETDDGCWYRYDQEGSLSEAASGFRVTNGPAFDRSRHCMYVTDSARRTIFRTNGWGADALTAKLEVFRTFGEDCGSPDGMTVDDQGRLWVAFWDGACVRALDPETGETLQSIPLPVPRPTSCAFGGVQGGTLFITSASIGLDPETLRRFPLSGGLFAVPLDDARGAAPDLMRLP